MAKQMDLKLSWTEIHNLLKEHVDHADMVEESISDNGGVEKYYLDLLYSTMEAMEMIRIVMNKAKDEAVKRAEKKN